MMRTPESTDAQSAAQAGVLELAYLGDAVHALMVRTTIWKATGAGVQKLHKMTAERVCAAGQAAAAARILPVLTDEEAAIYRRGKNHAKIRVPKGSTPAEYAAATGFEALFGYLYLCGREERIRDLFVLTGA